MLSKLSKLKVWQVWALVIVLVILAWGAPIAGVVAWVWYGDAP